MGGSSFFSLKKERVFTVHSLYLFSRAQSVQFYSFGEHRVTTNHTSTLIYTLFAGEKAKRLDVKEEKVIIIPPNVLFLPPRLPPN
jgi:hypothetical protein